MQAADIPLIEPLLSERLHCSPYRLFPTTGFRFTTDGLFMWAEDNSRWSSASLWWYLPDAMAIILFACLFMFLRQTWRTIPRGRKSCVVYCSVCRYELTPPQIKVTGAKAAWSERAARCPECGTRRPPVFWRGPLHEFGMWGIGFAAALSVSVAVLLMSLQIARPERVVQGSSSWPAHGLSSVFPAWSFFRKVTHREFLGGDIRRFSLSDAGGEIVARSRTYEVPDCYVSPDGKIVAVPDEWSTGNFVVIDRGGRKRTDFKIDRSENQSVSPIGFSSGGDAVFVQRWGTSPDLHAELLNANTRTGQTESIASVDVPHEQFHLSLVLPAHVIEDSNGLRWLIAMKGWDTEQKVEQLRVVVGSGQRQTQHTIRGKKLVLPRLTEAPHLLRLDLYDYGWSPSGDRSPPDREVLWNLESKNLESRPLPRPDTPRGETLSIQKSAAGQNMQVVDAVSGNTIATLADSTDGGIWTFSGDGLYVAGVVQVKSSSWLKRVWTEWPDSSAFYARVWKLPALPVAPQIAK